MGMRSTMKQALICAVAVLAAALPGCGTSPAPESKASTTALGAAGDHVTVPSDPRRVVVLDSTVLQDLGALGAGEGRIVGVPKGYGLPELEKASYKDVAGSGPGDLNYEAIEALRPDLIIAGWRFSPRDSEDVRAGLREIGAPILEGTPASRTARSLEDVVLELGKIFHEDERAKALVAEFDSIAAQVRAREEGAGTGLVVLSSGGRLYAYGPGADSRFGIFYDSFGVRPAMAVPDERGPHGNEVSLEAIHAANPSWLYVIDRDSSLGQPGSKPARQVLDNSLIASTTAGQKNQIVYFDPHEAYLGEGLPTYRDAGRLILAALSKAGR